MLHNLQPELLITDEGAIEGTKAWFLTLAASQRADTRAASQEQTDNYIEHEEREAAHTRLEIRILLERLAEWN